MPPSLKRRAVAMLAVLTAINFLNYIDRHVLAAVLEGVRTEFAVGDAKAGLLGFVFIVVYTVASPFAGWLGDRRRRKWIVAGSVTLWSLATVGSGLARSFDELMLMRALIGIGEAGYGTVAPGMIADLFDKDRRGRMLSFFYVAIPVGSALGFLLGGQVSANHVAVLDLVGYAGDDVAGWRVAFWFAGAPGLLMAVVAAFLPEPIRGAGDGVEVERDEQPWLDSVRRLFRTPAWRINTVGLTLMVFSMGGLAFWMPSFLQRVHGMDAGQAGLVFGGITVVAGLIATLLGGRLGDRAYAKSAGGYFRISGWGLVIGGPCCLAAALVDVKWAVFVGIFFAEFFMFLNTGPLNAVLVGCVPAQLRATAVAANTVAIHAFGDAFSPVLIGALSDGLGPSLGGEAAGLRLAIATTAFPILAGGIWLVRGARIADELPDGLLTVEPPK